MKNPRVLIIIPAYNEEESIENTVNVLKTAGHDFIVVNDGSTDNTLKKLQKTHCPYINLPFNLGIGGAMQTGYKYAYEKGYDIAVQFDADGQHDISYIKDLINPIKEQKANLTIGSVFIDKSSRNLRSSRIRKFGIKTLSTIIYIFSGKRVHDITSGFRAADKKVIKLFAENYPLEYPEPISNFELLKFSKLKIKEIPVVMHKRTAGKSSIRSWKNLYAVFNVLLSIILLTTRSKYE